MPTKMKALLLFALLAGSATGFLPVVRQQKKFAFRQSALFVLPDSLELPDSAYPSRIAVEEAVKVAADKVAAVVPAAAEIPSVSDVAQAVANTAAAVPVPPTETMTPAVVETTKAVVEAAVTATTTSPGGTADAAVSLGVDPVILGAAAAFLVIGAVVASTFGGGSSSEDESPSAAPAAGSIPEFKVDLSIPYDAAARLAYKQEKGTDPVDGPEFEKYKELYYEKAVAEVIAKTKAREATPAGRGKK